MEKIPNTDELTALIGKSLYDVWNKLCALIDGNHPLERDWMPVAMRLASRWLPFRR